MKNKKRSIKEDTTVIALNVAPDLETSLFEQMCNDWGNTEYSELSVILSVARAITMLHQTNHWSAKNDSYYGDHLLFDRLYNETLADIDTVAERVVGLACVEHVNITIQAKQVCKLICEVFSNTNVGIPHTQELMQRSYNAEMKYKKWVDICKNKLQARGCLTYGTDDLLAAIANKIEGRIYLLKQRLSF
jgi:DNA-binding ferritin-like protein